ncbi:MAG TPA: hypothetical protein VM266_06915, partial [Solirubrobacteraceae bacterium]|nr:hypothetical protein [Solirubrobacteraceae bacterium]
PDGRVEVFFSRDRRIQRALRPAGASAFQPPQTIRTTSRDNRVRDLALDTDLEGRAVLVYDDGIPGTRFNGLWALRRSGADGAFGAPDEIARTNDEELLPEVAVMPDGGALVAYRQERYRGRDPYGHLVLRARRALGTGPFGRDQTVSATEVVRRSTRGRDVAWLDLDVNARGEAVLGWTATCTACGDVAWSAVAAAGGRFRTPQVLSAPGYRIAPIAVGLAPDGDAIATWAESPGLFSRRARLRLATATRLPGAGLDALDRRPASGRLSVRGADVRAAVRTGRLPVRVRCSEACGATVSLPGVVWKVLGFDASQVSRRLILDGAGSGRVTIRFRKRSHRRALAKVIRRGPVAVRALLSDRAGNLTQVQVRVRVP